MVFKVPINTLSINRNFLCLIKMFNKELLLMPYKLIDDNIAYNFNLLLESYDGGVSACIRNESTTGIPLTKSGDITPISSYTTPYYVTEATTRPFLFIYTDTISRNIPEMMYIEENTTLESRRIILNYCRTFDNVMGCGYIFSYENSTHNHILIDFINIWLKCTIYKNAPTN